MKTRGLTFTADSILAMLTCAQCGVQSPGVCPECGSPEKRKTWTRRVAIPQPVIRDGLVYGLAAAGSVEFMRKQPWSFWPRCHQPGDIVYAKEALEADWGPDDGNESIPNALYSADDKTVIDGEDICEWPWKRNVLPSRFMPRWAARIWRKVVEVRAERVQDIREWDACAEGIVCMAKSADGDRYWWYGGRELGRRDSARAAFLAYWDLLYKDRPERQSAENPVVFAYRLKVSAREDTEDKQ